MATYKSGAVSRRVADLAALQDRKLALDAVGLLSRRRNDMEGADTLAVQAGVLGEALKVIQSEFWNFVFEFSHSYLANQQRNASRNKVPNLDTP